MSCTRTILVIIFLLFLAGPFNNELLAKPQFTDRTVDIYLAAGRNILNKDGEQVRSCNRFNTDSCDIYRVIWNLDTMKAMGYRRIVNERGYSEAYPAINPSGTHMAYERQEKGTNKSQIYSIRIGPKSIGKATPIIEPSIPVFNGWNHYIEGGRWPNWRGEYRLLFSHGAYDDDPYWNYDQWWDLYQGGIAYSKGKAFLSPPRVRLIVGDVLSGRDSSGLAAEDPYVHPTNPDLIGAHIHYGDGEGNCYVSKDDTTEIPPERAEDCMALPAVIDMSPATGPEIVDVLHNWAGIRSCAHVAFNSDGSKLLCTEQFTDTPAAICDIPCTKMTGQDRIYGFEYDAELGVYTPVNVTSETGLLFEHLRPLGLHNLDPLYPTFDQPNADGIYCERDFLHKYAHWCGIDDYVVATVFCATKAYDYQEVVALYSRIFLIDITDPLSPEYYDVTAELEKLLKTRHGQYFGYSSTCANYQE